MSHNRLLVVDDAAFMRQRIGQIAREAGWEIAGEAEDGQQAIELYQQLKPDLVTLDIVMPTLDGVETLKHLIKNDSTAKVVMVSAVNQKPKLIECIQAGAIDFIVKPFEKDDLRQFLARLLEKNENRKEN